MPNTGAEPPLDPGVNRVDGLVVLMPPEPGSTEDVTAALTFRVGVVDETIRTRGITHMVEHLAVSRFHAETLSWNGSVDLTRTRFTARGPAGEVTRFLNEVMVALSALPADRLDHERRVLQIEARSSAQGIASSLLTVRFGLQGPGLAPYPEWGVEWLGRDELQAWSDEWFTASNAVLWATAPLPDLVVALRAGRPRPPRLTIPHRPFPAAEVRDGHVLALSTLVPRTTTHLVAAMELERSLRTLRTEAALSYQTAVSHYPLSADHMLVTATADVHPEAVVEATDAFQAVLRDLAENGPRADHLEAHRRNLVAAFAGEDAAVGRLDPIAMAMLFGVPDPLTNHIPRDLAAITEDHVRGAAQGFLDHALLAVPPAGADAVLPPFEMYAPEPVPPVEGRTMRSSDPAVDHEVRLVYGAAGITHWDEYGEALTVRFDACVGVVAWPDGSRLIYRTDGHGLFLDPRQWLQFSRIRDCVDGHAAARLVHLPVAPDRPAAPKRGPVLRWIQRTVDRLPWGVVAVIIGVSLGVLVGALGAGLSWIVGELAWLGEHRDRVLAIAAMFSLIAAASWWEHRRKARARKARASGKGLGRSAQRAPS